MDFPCEDCTTEEGLIKELVGEGYFDFSDVEAIAISDQSYSNIAGEGKKVSLTVKTAEDGSTTEIIELTDDLNELIGGFTSSGEGTAEATIHYVTDENCAATLLELKSPIKGSPRRIADYTEDIYIIDLNGDGQDVKILSNFAFSETFTNQVSGFNPIYARNKAPLGEWTKKLLLRGFKKVTTFVASKSPWSIAINVVASYAIGGMIEYWVGDHENVPEAFFAHVIKEGFRGALANLVDAYGEGLASSVITATISYIIKTPFDQFDAQQMILQVAIGTVLNLITTSKNVERLRSVVGNVTTFTRDLIRVPSLISVFMRNKKLVKAWGGLFKAPDFIRRSEMILEKANELLEIGFTKIDLSILSGSLSKLKNRNIPNKDLEEIAEYALEARKHTNQYSSLNIETDLFKQIDVLASSSKFKNPEDLRQYLSKEQLLQNIADNPGNLEQLNEGVRVLKKGYDILLEGRRKLRGDVVNITKLESIQYKAITGVGPSTNNSNLRKAAEQFKTEFSVEQAREGYKKIVKLKILEPGNPQFNSNVNQLRLKIQQYIDANSTNSIGDNLRALTQIRIENGTGLYKFKIVNTLVIIVN